jgi:hypothetical protein
MLLLPISVQTFRDGVLLTVLKTSFFPLLSVLVWWGASKLFPAVRQPVPSLRELPRRVANMNRT